MALSIKDDTADKYARELAALTHQSITQVVIDALREKLEREQRTKKRNIEVEAEAMLQMARKLFGGPIIDKRSNEDILGYDENGLPT